MALDKDAVRSALGYDKAPPKLNSAQKKQMVNIRKLLRSDDWATVKSGLELAAGLGDAKINAHVAHGIRCTSAGRLTVAAESVILKTVKEPWRPNATLYAATLAPWAAHTKVLNLQNTSSVGWPGQGTVYVQIHVARGFVEAKRSQFLIDRIGSGGTTTAISDYSGLFGFTALESLTLDSPPQGLDSFKNLTHLRELEIRHCEDLQGPELDGMKAIEWLKLTNYNWSDLRPLAELTTLQTLHLRWCYSLENLTGVSGLHQLQQLQITDASSLANIDGLEKLTGLTDLTITGSKVLDNVGGLRGLPELSRITLRDHEALHSVQGLGDLPSLVDLKLQRCASLGSMKGSGTMPVLSELSLHGCGLETLVGLPALPNLVKLDLGNCDALQSLEGLPKAPKLTKLNLRGCDRIQSLQGLAAVPALTDLDLVQCGSLPSLKELSAVGDLKKLSLTNNTVLTSLEGLDGCTELEHLVVQDCTALNSLSHLKACHGLRVLDLHRCPSIDAAPELAQLEALQQLALTGLNIRDLGLLRGLPLQQLTLKDWTVKFDLDFLADLPHLKALNLSNCRYVPELIRGPLADDDLQTLLDVVHQGSD